MACYSLISTFDLFFFKEYLSTDLVIDADLGFFLGLLIIWRHSCFVITFNVLDGEL